jgi:hypothetical protein
MQYDRKLDCIEHTCQIQFWADYAENKDYHTFSHQEL